MSFIVLYGSQLGQAKSIAEDIHENAASENINTSLYNLKEFNMECFMEKSETYLIFIVSTTGDGEPPDDVCSFWNYLHAREEDKCYFQNINYTILGLGDSNYNNFCNCGKIIDRKLSAFGAKLFYSQGWADDGVGLELVVDSWLDGLWAALNVLKQSSPHIGVENLCDLDNLKLRPSIKDIHGKLIVREVDKNEIEILAEKLGQIKIEKKINNSSLLHSNSDLNSSNLKLPATPIQYIKIDFVEDQSVDSNKKLCFKIPFPSSSSQVSEIKLLSSKVLTSKDSEKMTLSMCFDISESAFSFEPGDSISLICPNVNEEVNYLLSRLGVSSIKKTVAKFSVLPQTLKKNPKVPEFLPENAMLEDIFKYYLDIRVVPKKTFLRALVEHTSDKGEKRRLQELVSREGSNEYNQFIREPGLTLLDLLMSFPSCKPNLETLIEHLPRLQPRPYSIANSPLVSRNCVNIVFNIIKIPCNNGIVFPRRGLCTGWLYKLHKLLDKHKLNNETEPEIKLFAFMRANNKFRFPQDEVSPVIMIGPGTGVAPFIGFLEHYYELKSQQVYEKSMSLYFGCRNRQKDYIFESELMKFIEDKVLENYYLSLSRENYPFKYVQDQIVNNKEEFLKILLEKNGVLYICGDAKNMANDVFQCIVSIIMDVKGISEKESRSLVANLQLSGKYLQDIWT